LRTVDAQYFTGASERTPAALRVEEVYAPDGTETKETADQLYRKRILNIGVGTASSAGITRASVVFDLIPPF
jgi:hypothetical protein